MGLAYFKLSNWRKKLLNSDLDTLAGSCGPDGVRVWDLLPHGRQLLHIPHPDAVCLAFVTDGTTILVGYKDGAIRMYAPQSGRLLTSLGGAHPAGVTALKWLGGGCLATGAVDGQVRFWRGLIYATKLEFTLRAHKNRVTALEVAAGGKELLSASKDGSCVIYDVTE